MFDFFPTLELVCVCIKLHLVPYSPTHSFVCVAQSILSQLGEEMDCVNARPTVCKLLLGRFSKDTGDGSENFT